MKRTLLSLIAIACITSAKAQLSFVKEQSFVKDGITWVSTDPVNAKVKDFYPVKPVLFWDSATTVKRKKNSRVCPVCGSMDCGGQAFREAEAKRRHIDVKILEKIDIKRNAGMLLTFKPEGIWR